MVGQKNKYEMDGKKKTNRKEEEGNKYEGS